MEQSDFTICLVGAGNMGGAMLAGWLDNGINVVDITVIDPAPREDFAKRLEGWGITPIAKALDGYHPDVMIIAVKPQLMEKVLPSLADTVGPDTVSVSVAAGTTLAFLQNHLGENSAVVRAMPNTPALLGRGMTVACPNKETTKVQIDQVSQLLKATGKLEWVEDEKLIDSVTAVSGSGPAYVFHLAESMALAGVKAGLPEDLSETLARETIAGAGEMLSQLSAPADTLRENVTSPNGTTAAALEVLMAEPGMKELVERAIMAAKKRSEELSG